MIFIDGVNVSGCQYCLRNGEVCGYVEDMGGCKDRPHCLYKKLARAEKKIVKLKKTNERLAAQNTAYLTCYKAKHGDIKARLFRLEEENKKLKEENELLQRLEKENDTLKITREKLLGDLCIAEDSLKDYQEHYNRLKKENEELKEKNIELQIISNEIDRFNKYRQALEEIKEIILQDCKNCKWNISDIMCGSGDCGDGKLQIIHNKIDEVLK